MQNYVGKQIDRYRITERLGMGGMAVVYQAYDTRLERDVALKLIRTGSIPPDQYDRLMKRFEREAKSQARFDHKHIVHIYDYGEVDGSPYLVMALVPGGTLKDRLHGPLDWRQAVRWLIPIAEALAYAHKEGIIHRDVKPANILFDKEDQPILTDFGIAKILETDEATLTGTGLGVGTPEYMAPEQWQGKTSEATDQYALGVVLYELITGRKPYSADTPAAVAIMQATEPLAPPSGLVQEIPDAVEKALYKALARDPQDRYEDMDTFGKALRGLVAQAPAEESTLSKRTTPPPDPAPAVKEAVSSESVTRDALDATPAGGIPQPKASDRGEKKGLPKWAGWIIGGILGLVLITLALNWGSKSINIPKADNTQVVSIATETEEATTAPTETSAPTLTAAIILTPEPAFGIGSTMINEIDGAEMLYVPAGDFLMGSEDAEANSDEAPEHTVYLDAYWIYKYEVTNTQYRQCIDDGICSGDITRYPENDYPARFIDWYEATEYCEWAGGRLPTEAEWEKAARGENGQTYPWGEAEPICDLANYENCDNGIMSVGSYPKGASPYGALDMAGNVWEWVGDWYGENYYRNSSISNPTGPESGSFRILRGGSWYYYEQYLRVSYRLRYYPIGYDDSQNGFRCVSSSTP